MPIQGTPVNNPGNMVGTGTALTQFDGATVNQNNTFLQFATPADGYRAIIVDMRTKISEYGTGTGNDRSLTWDQWARYWLGPDASAAEYNTLVNNMKSLTGTNGVSLNDLNTEPTAARIATAVGLAESRNSVTQNIGDLEGTPSSTDSAGRISTSAGNALTGAAAAMTASGSPTQTPNPQQTPTSTPQQPPAGGNPRNKVVDLKCVLPQPQGRNPLHDLSNYTYRLIISTMDIDTYNNFVTGQGGRVGTGKMDLPKPGTILIASGGANLQGSVVEKNKHGVQDFFFKELILETAASGTSTQANPTYALSIDFTLIEPIGTTLFERLYYAVKDIPANQRATIDQKSTVFASAEKKLETKRPTPEGINLTQPVFLLTIEFKGYHQNPSSFLFSKNPKNSREGDYYRKYQIPIMLSSIDTEITHSGTEYKVKAYPAASEVYWTNNQSLPATTFLTEGKKLPETLDQLSGSWTAYHNRNIPQGISPNDYVFRIAKPSELDPNDPNTPAAKAVLAQWEQTIFRGGNPIDASRLRFMPPAASGNQPGQSAATFRSGTGHAFMQGMGTTALEIVHQIMIRTDYIKNEVERARTGQANAGIWWFTVKGIMTFNRPPTNQTTPPSKKFEYVIEPILMMVHNGENQEPICDEPDIKIFRKYEYIFTGKNSDIIRWDLDYNGFLYTQLQVDEPAQTGGQSGNPTQGATNATGQNRSVYPATSYPTLNEINQNSSTNRGYSSGRYRVDWFKTDGKNANAGRVPRFDEIQSSAFMETLWRQYNSKTQWDLDMEIIGDPDYLSSYDIFGNSTPGVTAKAPEPGKKRTPEERAQDRSKWANLARNSQTLIGVQFKTPVDVDPRTLQYKGMRPADLSRIYGIIKIKHIFRNGKFTQQLRLAGTDKECCFTPDGKRYIIQPGISQKIITTQTAATVQPGPAVATLPPITVTESRLPPDEILQSAGFLNPAASNPVTRYPNATITSRYGMRRNKMHDGVDIYAPPGTPSEATITGVVVGAGPTTGGYGNVVLVATLEADGTYTVMRQAHLQSISPGIVPGAIVSNTTDIVGAVGYTGNVEPKGPGGSHLHLEYWTGITAEQFKQYAAQAATNPGTTIPGTSVDPLVYNPALLNIPIQVK